MKRYVKKTTQSSDSVGILCGIRLIAPGLFVIRSEQTRFPLGDSEKYGVPGGLGAARVLCSAVIVVWT